MSVYMVERILRGASIESIEAIRRELEDACRTFVAAGRPIRHLQSIYTPGESRYRCLFEAPHGDLVRELNDAAQLPYSRVILAMDLAAQ